MSCFHHSSTLMFKSDFSDQGAEAFRSHIADLILEIIF